MKIETKKSDDFIAIKIQHTASETPKDRYDAMLSVTYQFARDMVIAARQSGVEDITVESFIEKYTDDLKRIRERFGIIVRG